MIIFVGLEEVSLNLEKHEGGDAGSALVCYLTPAVLRKTESFFSFNNSEKKPLTFGN